MRTDAAAERLFEPQAFENTPYRSLRLFLIKPSKYDDDGYVIRYWKGVLPSNTLACLYGLSEEVRLSGVLGAELKWRIEALDDTVQRIDVEKIARAAGTPGTKTLVCLAGVQSNQYPRAADLALEFRKRGIEVLIGGFHVSGVAATLDELPAEVKALQDAGVTVVAGEIEGRWAGILGDALRDCLKPLYNFLKEPPELGRAGLPKIPANLLNRYAVTQFSTLDCGRGCPFSCSFCTVINVQGRKMRCRGLEAIEEMIRFNYREHKIRHYFFTDDNFCRNKNWPGILDVLIRLRAQEKMPVTFMIQADTQSHRVPGFIEKAARAGCSQVFIGMESLNADNLKAAGKSQNKVDEFKELIQAYHNGGIAVHLAYIIGFPFDTELSVKEDMERLRGLGAEQASFFMLTPLPGSIDYKNRLRDCLPMDADLNRFDSFHETVFHPHMRGGSWTRVYEEAWKAFYGFENMKKILRAAKPEKYWDVFLNFLWYKNAIQVEGGHPMVHGFFRLKSRRERRSIFPLESRLVFLKRRAREIVRTFAGWCRLALEMEELWLATRRRGLLETRVVLELERSQRSISDWRELSLSKIRAHYHAASAAVPHASPARVPSALRLWFQKWNLFSDVLTVSRRPRVRYWSNVARNIRLGRPWKINPIKVCMQAALESIFLARFLRAFVKRTAETV